MRYDVTTYPSTAPVGPISNATGNGSTDDRAAIQKCLDDCAAAQGGVVYFPKGQYKITSGLTVSAVYGQVQMLGEGASDSVIVNASATANTLTFDAGGTRLFSPAVRDLGLNRSVVPANTSMGLRLIRTSNAVIENVTSSNSGIQFYMFACWNGYYRHCSASRSIQASGSADTYSGFQITDNTSGHIPASGVGDEFGNYSSVWECCTSIGLVSAAQTNPFPGVSYGFFFQAKDMRDMHLRSCQADTSQYGFYLDGSQVEVDPRTTGLSNFNWDIDLVD